MSTSVVVEVFCDGCGHSELFNGANRSEARKHARKLGWKCNIKPTAEKPAEFDTRRDECPRCKKASRV